MPILLLMAAAGGAYDPSAMDWVGQISQPTRALYRVVTVPLGETTLTRDVSWTPTYPDWLNRQTVRAADQRAYFGEELPLPAVRVPPPVYPDRIPAKPSLLTAQQKAFFRPETPMPEAPRLSWQPTYPDRLNPPRGLLTAQQPFYTSRWQPDTPYDPRELGWNAPQYALPIRRAYRVLTVPLEEALFTTTYDPSAMDWFQRPELAPFKRRFRLLTSVPLGEPQSLLPWIAPIYPDRVLGKTSLLTAQQTAYFGPITTPVAFLVAYTAAYDSVYPSQLWPKPSILTAQQKAFFRPETPMPNAPALSWHPLYPDRIDPKKALGTHLIPFYRSEELPLPGAPNTSNLAIYPDKVWPKASLLAAQQKAFFRPETPLPNAPALSWHPLYPDFAKGPAGLHVSNQLAFTKPWIPVIQQPRTITLTGNYYPLITLVGNYQILITPTGDYIPVIVLTGVIA